MTLIQRHDGTIYDLLDYGIRTRDLIISSPTPINHFEAVDGSHGVIDCGTTYGPRNITAYYRAQSVDIVDFSLLRDEIFNIFRTEESFYLIEKRLRGKRWLVKVADPYAIPQRNIFGNFEVEFIGLKGFSESIGTTADIDSNGVNADDELWGFGMGLTSDFREDDDPLKYTIHAKEGEYFRIFNAGNVAVHPFQMDLKITIKDVVGSDGRVQLRNQANQDYIRINDDDITENDVFVFDGASVTKNGTAFLRNTHRTFISLEPGWNRLQNYYCDSATIVFDFRFYYL